VALSLAVLFGQMSATILVLAPFESEAGKLSAKSLFF
jgi:hypothetical protein